MKGLTYSFAARTAAAFLMFFTAMTACYAGAAGLAAYLVGFYSVPDSVVYSTALDMLENEIGYANVPGEAHTLFELIFDLRYAVIALFVISIVVLLVLFIFLMCSAGRRAGHPGPHLNFFDRIPFDLFTAAMFFAVAFAALIIDELSYSVSLPGGTDSTILIVTLISLGITAAILLLTWYCTTFAARVKSGKWWRNTVIFMVLHGVWRTVRGFFRWCGRVLRAVSVAKRLTCAVAVFLAVQFFVSYAAFNYHGQPFFVFLLLLMDIAFLAVIILIAGQLKSLKAAGEMLASGKSDHKVNTAVLSGDFRRHGENLNSIADGINLAVEERMRSERLKTELITNVSHDIKTPLTSIANYVDLLKKAPTAEEQAQYLDVLSRQSARLKKLTEDLVEASKASTGAIAVELMPTNLDEIIDQSLAEYAERLRLAGLTPIYTPSEGLSVTADGRLLWRVLDNLLNNAVKYAQPGTRVYIDAVSTLEGDAIISVKNISRDRLNVSADELMERFVRGDTSRSTEGSGLGLNIARSLVELMGGYFTLFVDGDLFKAEITLPLAGGIAR